METKSTVERLSYRMEGDSIKRVLNLYHLIISPSYQCNLKCNHCYLPDHSKKILPENIIHSIIDEWSQIVLSERGIYGGIFHLKGGEPLILPYFEEIIDHLGELKILQFMLTTNGVTTNWKLIDRLNSLKEKIDGNVTIIVSLDGSSEEINSLLRHKGNFSKTVNFCQQLSEAEIPFFLNNVVHTGNLDDIENFSKLALELGASQVNFLSFVPKGFGENLVLHRPNPLEVFQRIQNIWERGDEQIMNLLTGSLSDILFRENCGICTSRECVGGYRGLMYIVPDGTVYSCPNLTYPELEVGNIKDTSLMKIHDSINVKVYNMVKTGDREPGDRYLCKGERYLTGSTSKNSRQFKKLQNILGHNVNSQGTAYCFSRNF